MTHVRVCWANAWGARATQIGAGMRRSFVTPDEVYVALVALLCADLGPAVSARAVLLVQAFLEWALPRRW